MQPHTLSYSCAVHPVIKLTGAWDSELKKCLLPGTIIVTGCKCTRLWSCNHPSAAGNHWSDVVVSVRGPMGEWTPSMSSAYTRPVRSRWSPGSSETRVTWLVIPHPHPIIHPHPTCIGGTRGLIWKRHWRPHSEDRSLLSCPSKRAPCSVSAFLTGSPLAELLLMPAEHFYQHFTPLRGAKSQGRARLPLPRNPDLPLLINVYSQHQTHHLLYFRTIHYPVGGPRYCHLGRKKK